MTSTPPDGGRGSGSSDAAPASEPQRADQRSTVRIAPPRAAKSDEPQSTEDFLKSAETVSLAALNADRGTMDTVDAASVAAPDTEDTGGVSPGADRYEPVRLLGTGG